MESSSAESASLAAFNRALEHAPRAPRGPCAPDLAGWTLADGSTVCWHCAARAIERGCGNALQGDSVAPVWGRPAVVVACQSSFCRLGVV